MSRFTRQATTLLAVAGAGILAGCSPSKAGRDDVAVQVERGRQLLSHYHCGTCHTIPGVAASRGRFAAALDDYGRRSYIAGRVANEPAALARWIVEPASLVPGTLMPNMGVAPGEAQDMAAYLGQLR